MRRLFSALLLVPFAAADLPADCDACQAQVAELENIWLNETTVEGILKNLDSECKQKFLRQPEKIKICDEVASIVVQIPPGIFEGLESLDWPIPLGVCATAGHCKLPCCAPDAGPEQIHLSLGGITDMSRMGVSWVDLDSTSSAVEYKLADGTGPTFSSIGTILPPGTIPGTGWAGWYGTIHRAVMEALVANTSYVYRVGDGSSEGWSEWIQFTTLPTSFGPEDSVGFAIIGDMDYGPKSDNVVANLIDMVNDGTVRVVVHSGDISYADGYMPHWDVFLNKVQPIASRVPYMVVAGNHELWYNFSDMKHRFMMPGVEPLGDSESTGSGDGMYYTWAVPGLVHFLAADSETPIDTANFGAAQVDWMATALAAADTDEARAQTPWSIAHFHRPMYCSNDGECTGMDGILRNQAEALFLENHVDMVFSGHIHSYERTYPMTNWTATMFSYDNTNAPVYVVQGSSGNRESNDGFPADLPSWSGAHSSNIGFGLLVATTSKLDFTFFTAAADGPIVTDHFALTR